MNTIQNFPATRLRRLRKNHHIRTLISDVKLTPNDLIYPIFITNSDDLEIPSLPGIKRYRLSDLEGLVNHLVESEITTIALFPHTSPTLKNEAGSEATNPNNLICKAIKIIKTLNSDILIIADVALDPYTDHGHDGIIKGNIVDNDTTAEILVEQALILAGAGADIIAPSDMMDGRIGKIRKALEANNFPNTLIMSYAAKYASHFYGPFRDAVGVTQLQKISDKKSYQLNPQNSYEWKAEIALDIQEGADMIIIKPGMPYLDVMKGAAERFDIPIFAYQVSGEYALFKNYPDQDSGLKMLYESLISFKRAGCSGILTYAALEISKLLKN